MEFGLNEDQRLLQDSVERFLAGSAPLERVRAAAGGDGDAAGAIADGLAALGVNQIMVPQAQGGLGLGLLDAALVQEMLGRHVAPAAFLAPAGMAVAGLCATAAAEREPWLARIAAGEIRLAAAVSERAGARDGAEVRAGAGTLSGRAMFVLEPDGASHALIADREGALHVLDLAAQGVRRESLQTIDRTRSAAVLHLADAPAERLEDEGAAGDGVRAMLRTGRVLLAADTLGAAQAMLEKAVAYAGEREQFGRPIGSFQAVKHLCAEMAARLEPCRALIWHAAHAHDALPDEADLLACLAKAHLAEVGPFVARTATEVHGGMGFTDLLGLHYWFKRIGANRQWLGGPERVRAEAARLQGWA